MPKGPSHLGATVTSHPNTLGFAVRNDRIGGAPGPGSSGLDIGGLQEAENQDCLR